MALLIRAEELAGRLDVQAVIEATEAGYREQATWPGFAHPRQRVFAEDRRLTLHYGGAPGLAVAGVFAHYERFAFTAEDQSYAGAARRVYVAFDSETAELLAIIVGSLPIFPIDRPGVDFGSETAITSAVGTRHLARSDARRLGLFGTGRQARRHLLAMAAIRPLESVRVYSRDRAHRLAFCAEMQPLVGAELCPVEHPRDVVQGTDIIVCATGSNRPVFEGDWLEPGQHVTSIVGSNKELVQEGLIATKRRELDDTVLRRADVVVATLRDQAIQDEQGDLFDPVAREVLAWSRVGQLSELVAGRILGRTAADQISVFKQNSDQGVGYMGLARYVHDLALQHGLGIEV
jgi:alanine dehydrogenase